MSKHEPPRGSLGSCVLLAALAALATGVDTVVSVLVGGLFLGLLVAELDRSGRLLGVWIVRAASWLLPKRCRQSHASEWRDHILCAGDEGLKPVLVAVHIAILGAPRIAVRLRMQPLLWRYVLALMLAAVQVVRADPGERRRGSTFSACKACVRLAALPVTPLLALPVARRLERILPRWLLYATGLTIQWWLASLTGRTPFWIVALLVIAWTAALLLAGIGIVLASERLVPFAARMASPPDA